jgi:FAD synthetase
MNLKQMVSKYIINAERVFNEMKRGSSSVRLTEEKIENVIETAKRYLDDAKYYQIRSKFETSLASVTYCEGLLDALRLLGAVRFSWQTKQRGRLS